MVMNASSIGYLVYPGHRKIFDTAMAQFPKQYERFFHMNTTVRQYEEDISTSGFGLAAEKREGQIITFDEANQRYKTRYTWTVKALGYQITREMQEDDLYSFTGKLPTALADSMNFTVEIDGADVFNNGFDTSYTGADGVALFSTSHPKISGTQANKPSTDIDLSITGLQNAITAMRKTTDDRGKKTPLKPNLLVIPPDLEWTAYELLNSSNKPGTANNDVNSINAIGGLEIAVWDYLTDTDAWFLMDSMRHNLNFFWRRRVEFKSDNSVDTDVAKFVSSMRYGCGWSDWRGVYGSAGA